MQPTVNEIVENQLKEKVIALENYLESDVLCYSGPIVDGNEKFILHHVEGLAAKSDKKNSISIVITTGGGSASAVERYVNIIRHHYDEVHFYVPDYAFSAGTIFCMSGDKIFMDYSSVLGPIDPQVQNKDGQFVAALGYLDKVNEMIEKSRNNQLTQAEFLLMRDIDLAALRSYEQAKELTISLLKNWLVKYKFKDWHKHRTNEELLGQKVTDDEKIARATAIASALSDNSLWKSHSRPINIDTLQELRLEIEDYSSDKTLTDLLRSYNDLLVEHCKRNNYPIFIHSKIY